MIYLSLGAGLQSSALLVASARGLWDVPRADVAIFADTQDEPAWVYENIERLRAHVDIPIETVTRGKLSDGARGTKMLVPAFTLNKDGSRGMTRRQCTSDFKIKPIQKRVAQLLGRKPGARKGPVAEALLGISTDEAHRMKPAAVSYITNRYPLVEAGKSRADCVLLLSTEGFKVPKKSACVFCPYHSNSYWRELKMRHPEEWSRAVAYDEKIRNSSKAGLRLPCFIHSSLRPLRAVDLNENQLDLFGNECEGLCGV